MLTTAALTSRAQSFQDRLFQRHATNFKLILAGAFVACGGAAEMGLADLDVVSIAGAALDEAGKLVTRPMPVPGLDLGTLRAAIPPTDAA
jgi:hypothetical protein